jgi:hypothetical protein
LSSAQCLLHEIVVAQASFVISILKRTKIHYVGMLKTILPVLSLADDCHLKNQTCSMVMLIVPICYNHNTKCTTDCFFSPSFDIAFGLKMEIRNKLVSD